MKKLVLKSALLFKTDYQTNIVRKLKPRQKHKAGLNFRFYGISIVFQPFRADGRRRSLRQVTERQGSVALPDSNSRPLDCEF